MANANCKLKTAQRPFAITAKDGKAEVWLYDEISAGWGISAKQFRQELKAAGDVSEIHLRINSPGGEVLEGLAIYNTLRQHPARVIAHIDGMALSMASAVAMAAHEIEAAENSWLMIHNPAQLVFGDAEGMREAADLLDRVRTQLVNIYADRTKQPAAKIAELMDAETWLTGPDASALGFVDRVTDRLAVAASLDPSRYARVPEGARALISVPSHQPQEIPAMADAPNPQTPAPAPQAATPPALPQPQPAAFHDLKAGLPGADDAFLCSQLSANATLPAAQSAWMAEQARRIEAANKAVEAAKAQAKKPGLDIAGEKPAPKGAAGEDDGDPKASFDAKVRQLVARGTPRQKACVQVARANPDLHRAFLRATNAGKPAALALLEVGAEV